MRTVKIVLAVAALLITALSLWVSHRLTRDLEQEERNRIRIYVKRSQPGVGTTFAIELPA